MCSLADELTNSLQTFQKSGNPAIAQNAAQYLTMMGQATAGLNQVKDSVSKVVSMRQFLEGDRLAIESRLPRGSLNQQSKSSLDKVTEGWNTVNSMLTRRDEEFKKLAILAEDTTRVREELSRYGGDANLNSIYISGFAPVVEILHTMEKERDTQMLYLNELKSKVEIFSKVREEDEVIRERQMIFEQLSEALKAFESAQQFLNEGITFYTHMESSVKKLESQQSQSQSQSQYQYTQYTQPQYTQPTQSQYQPTQTQYQPAQTQYYQPQYYQPQYPQVQYAQLPLPYPNQQPTPIGPNVSANTQITNWCEHCKTPNVKGEIRCIGCGHLLS